MIIYNLISKFNKLTENKNYVNIFWSLYILCSFISFILQSFHDKYCDLFTELIIIIHHFSVFLIYCSFLAPTNYLLLLSIFPTVAIISWLLYNNRCFLTTIQQIRCNYKKNYRFHDLFYFIDLFLSKFKLTFFTIDKLNIKYRIRLLVILIIFILFRLYVYFTTNYINKFEIHGHRGSRGKYPENSISAFNYAMSANIDVLEMDLNITKDKNIIIYHDKTINTKLCKNGLSLPIKEMTLNEIKKYTCGEIQNINFKEQNTSREKIPTFIELLDMINISNHPNKNTIMFNIEIKTEKNLDTNLEVIEFIKSVITILNKYNIKDRTIIQSFDDRALTAVKHIDSSIKLSLLIESDNINMIEVAKKIDVNIISPFYKLLNKELVKQIHNNGFKVLPWTINSTKHLQEMIDMNVDGIISDYPKEMMDYIYKT
jgi:glycerophosphoryl diester phosphodiesterase